VAGSYAVVATINDSYYHGTASGILVVWGAPEIAAQPKPVNALVNGNATFWVGIAGAKPMSYQWRWNGKPIAGATGSSVSFANLAEDRCG
jgi:hypothetical protein